MAEETLSIAMPRENTLPKDPEKRRILGEFYDINKNKQWFWRAEYIENHPTHMCDTLVIYPKYNPVLEMKDILTFGDKYKIALEIVPLSHEG